MRTADEAAFDRLFALRVATTEEEQRQAFAVRYRVYCEELSGFEQKERFPDGLERNPTDDHSVQVLVIRRENAQPVATARLVLTDPTDPTTPLPFEEACSDTLDPWALPQDAAERRSIAEISRVSILGTLRNRSMIQSEEERAAVPLMFLGLTLVCTALAQHADIGSLFGLMEERFAYLCRTYGIQAMPVGPAVSFHGLRVPYQVSPEVCRQRFPELTALADAVAAEAFPLLPLLHVHQRC